MYGIFRMAGKNRDTLRSSAPNCSWSVLASYDTTSLAVKFFMGA
jgi:hypothetical protein